MAIHYNDFDFYDFMHDGDGSLATRKILVEGDSWVSHPQLQNLAQTLDMDGNGDYAILNLADPGATAREMFAKKSKQFWRLERLLTSKKWGFDFDLIVLSAGGNDIIGPEIKEFLLNKTDNPGKQGIELIDDTALKITLDEILGLYRQILTVIGRSRINAETPVVTHCYCALEPREVGTHLGAIKFNRGWVERYMEDDRNIFDGTEQRIIIKEMLKRFRDSVRMLETEFEHFVIADTLNTLSKNGLPQTDMFHDEIHPNRHGFKKVYRRIKNVAKRRGLWV